MIQPHPTLTRTKPTFSSAAAFLPLSLAHHSTTQTLGKNILIHSLMPHPQQRNHNPEQPKNIHHHQQQQQQYKIHREQKRHNRTLAEEEVSGKVERPKSALRCAADAASFLPLGRHSPSPVQNINFSHLIERWITAYRAPYLPRAGFGGGDDDDG